jgi:putative hydrolase of the HAD superfamily
VNPYKIVTHLQVTLNIEAVILDFGGTLVESEMNWNIYNDSIKELLEENDYRVSTPEIKNSLRKAIEKLHQIRDTGKELTFEEVYNDFLERLGVNTNPDILSKLHDNFKAHYKSTFFDCTEKVLKKLNKEYKVALLSNTMSDQPHLLLNDSGYDRFFDIIICSRDIGVRKPNPEAFNIILNKLGVEPEKTVHVGDSVEADMYGAVNSGITGIWIKNDGQPEWNGYAIDSICDLPEFLKKIRDLETI